MENDDRGRAKKWGDYFRGFKSHPFRHFIFASVNIDIVICDETETGLPLAYPLLILGSR